MLLYTLSTSRCGQQKHSVFVGWRLHHPPTPAERYRNTSMASPGAISGSASRIRKGKCAKNLTIHVNSCQVAKETQNQATPTIGSDKHSHQALGLWYWPSTIFPYFWLFLSKCPGFSDLCSHILAICTFFTHFCTSIFHICFSLLCLCDLRFEHQDTQELQQGAADTQHISALSYVRWCMWCLRQCLECIEFVRPGHWTLELLVFHINKPIVV